MRAHGSDGSLACVPILENVKATAISEEEKINMQRVVMVQSVAPFLTAEAARDAASMMLETPV